MIDPFKVRTNASGERKSIEALYQDIGVLLYMYDKDIYSCRTTVDYSANEIKLNIQMDKEWRNTK